MKRKTNYKQTKAVFYSFRQRALKKTLKAELKKSQLSFIDKTKMFMQGLGQKIKQIKKKVVG